MKKSTANNIILYTTLLKIQHLFGALEGDLGDTGAADDAGQFLLAALQIQGVTVV